MNNAFQHFRRDRQGLVATEYMILLALLTGLSIGAILLMGGNLNAVWSAYAAADLVAGPPVTP